MINTLCRIGVCCKTITFATDPSNEAFIQTTIFTTLTMLLIAAEIPAPVDVDLNKIKEKKERKAKRVKKTQNA